jgi:uncharacterized protein involved in exopolysaccharide biosynthesis
MLSPDDRLNELRAEFRSIMEQLKVSCDLLERQILVAKIQHVANEMSTLCVQSWQRFNELRRERQAARRRYVS